METEKRHTILNTINKFYNDEHFTVFTDGSKINNKSGVGIHFKNTKETILIDMSEPLSIISLETLEPFNFNVKKKFLFFQILR